jgi:precorrin-6B methylase 2
LSKLLKFGLLSNELSEEMNLYQATAYARHRLYSKNAAGHGVHSPFVYNFLTNVIRGENNAEVAGQVEALRREMKRDRQVITVTDMGAGSMKNNDSLRRVSDIAQYAALPAKQIELLMRMAGSLERGAKGREQGERGKEKGAESREPGGRGEGIILELGASLGISSLGMALAAPERKVITVEGCSELARLAETNLRKYGAENTEILNMEFSEALKTLKTRNIRVDFAFIDGNHRGEALVEYVNTLTGMGEEMIIVADDIHLSRDMYQAWKDIVESHIAEASMETLRFGILFRRKSLTPGRYKIWC